MYRRYDIDKKDKIKNRVSRIPKPNSKAKSLPSAVINIMMDDAHGAELSAHDVQRSGDRRHDTHG
jgi:hypothetical protein